MGSVPPAPTTLPKFSVKKLVFFFRSREHGTVQHGFSVEQATYETSCLSTLQVRAKFSDIHQTAKRLRIAGGPTGPDWLIFFGSAQHFLLAGRDETLLNRASVGHISPCETGQASRQGRHTMTFSQRMNFVAVLIAFSFVTAIVLGLL